MFDRFYQTASEVFERAAQDGRLIRNPSSDVLKKLALAEPEQAGRDTARGAADDVGHTGGLADGGHLTHGAKPSFSGKIYHAVQYGLHAETGEIDYEQVESLAREHQPKMIIAGFSAYSRILDWQRFRKIADSVGAYLMVDMGNYHLKTGACYFPVKCSPGVRNRTLSRQM